MPYSIAKGGIENVCQSIASDRRLVPGAFIELRGRMPGERAEGQPNHLGIRRTDARPTCDGNASVRQRDHLLRR
jgi:hypothetical protein